MARPVPGLLAIAGLAFAGLGGVALGQYAASGVDPTKAAAYRNGGYAELAARVSDDNWKTADTGATTIPASYAVADTPLPASSARY